MIYKVLYIEDNPLNVRLVKRSLKGMPIHILCASNGEDGIQMVKHEKPDLILLDINLPTISGIDVLIHVKSHRQTLFIPVIALTADTTLQTRNLCKLYGVSAYLQKPISRHTLIQTIQMYLSDVIATED